MAVDPATPATYAFPGGFPENNSVTRAYDEADLNRAIQAYRFFYPTVSGLAMIKGNEAIGLRDNEVFGLLDTHPTQVGYTLNSDTPYAPVPLDLRAGPIVLDIPAGPILGAVLDVNQRWVADVGVPGPDAGQGGRHLLLPPGWEGEAPDGFFVARATSYRIIVGLRSLPEGGDVTAALNRLRTVQVRPLDPSVTWPEPIWVDFSDRQQDITPLAWETNLGYWRALHEVIESEPYVDSFGPLYGELAALGITKGQAFDPDERMTAILELAAVRANAQMRVQAFADRRSDRVVWPDRQWEWAALRFEDGDFNTAGHIDVDAREKWFFQAIASSPAMFRRAPGAGSLYWLGLRDSTGSYLDGGHSYRLTVPLPVPAKLFWSVTVYDAETRSQIQTDQNKAALRSLFELHDHADQPQLDLYFGPTAPSGHESQWVKTIPGKGWFVYFRVYGPAEPAFDGTWKPADFERID